MLTYNTQQPQLILPEYGRTIQQMVTHCLTLEDRDERNKCACSIISAMANLFPQVKNSVEDRMKLWDHLAIMSGFKLDIDYPVEIVDAGQLATKPEPVSYVRDPIPQRHYGRYVIEMIRKASEMDDNDERTALAVSLANHMKKALILDTNDYVDDKRIFHDLLLLSNGAINLNDKDINLYDFKEIPQQGKKKKKR